MIKIQHSMIRETGTALAVAAIYILTLLLPLHQAAGLQRDLATIGYETVGKVSICNPAQPDTPDTGGIRVVTCAAAGIVKTAFADAVDSPALKLAFATTGAVAFATFDDPKLIDLGVRAGWSRAPPLIS